MTFPETGPGTPLPMSIIVGVARLGTTLLRLMLDAHRDISIPAETRTRAMWFELDDLTFERKRAAAYAYHPLAHEVESVIEKMGEATFRVECLRPVDPWITEKTEWTVAPPWYERYGEERVAAGYYQRVIRYREHIHPLAKRLLRLKA